MKYLLMSDIHFHNWDTFATYDEDGTSSRLKDIVSAVYDAMGRHLKNGGDKLMVIAGDIFHERGAVKTNVINITLNLFKDISSQGWQVYLLTGNHDLQSSSTKELTSAVTALSAIENVRSINSLSIYTPESWACIFYPWAKDVQNLKIDLNNAKELGGIDLSKCDLIIHAPIDGVIGGLPELGLTSEYLAGLGFKRVFAGHYHDHKDFGNNVYSIGALTHQTFSDIGAKAGFVSVGEDVKDVKWYSSNSPRFVEINQENYDDAPLIVDGNYVRCTVTSAKVSDVKKLREELLSYGALGVVVNQCIEKSTERDELEVEGSTFDVVDSLPSIISAYVKAMGMTSLVNEKSIEIINKVTRV